MRRLSQKYAEKITRQTTTPWDECDITRTSGYFMTLEEVGKELKVTRERVRQIEAKAIRKLQHPKHSKILKEFLW